MLKIVLGAMWVLMLIGISALAFEMRPIGTSDARTILVPIDFASIQEAINNASDGDIVEVLPRALPYCENVTVNKTLVVRRWANASASDYLVVDGGNRQGVVFDVVADLVNISGFTVRNGLYGIRLVGSSCTICNNTVTSNTHGIYIETNSTNDTLAANNLTGNTWNFGINPNGSIDHFIHSIDKSNTVDTKHIYYWVNETDASISATDNAGYVAVVNSTNIIVKDQNIMQNDQGIFLAYVSNVTVFRNTIKNSGVAVYVQDSSDGTVIGNQVVSNSMGVRIVRSDNYAIDGNTIADSVCGVYVVNSSDIEIDNNSGDSNYYGVSIVNSDRSAIRGNYAENDGGTGFKIDGSKNTAILGNVVVNSLVGAYMRFSDNSTMCDNVIVNNGVAVETMWCNASIFTGNTFAYSSDSVIVFEGSNNSVFCHNNFIDNGKDKKTHLTTWFNLPLNNTWDNGLEGNYWSNANFTDKNIDGICDNPFIIINSTELNYTEIDRHPLSDVWNSIRFMDVTFWNCEHRYNVITFCNHVVAEKSFQLNLSLKQITFNITAGSEGFCNITIPRVRLDGPFNVTVDGDQTTLIETPPTEELTSLYFNYTLGIHQIKIVGTERGYIVGDVNGDGIVEMMDFYWLSQNFGSTEEKPHP